MSANPFLTSFASLFHSVYQTYFTSITYNGVVKLDLHQAIVDAIAQSDGARAFKACQDLLAALTSVRINKQSGMDMVLSIPFDLNRTTGH